MPTAHVQNIAQVSGSSTSGTSTAITTTAGNFLVIGVGVGGSKTISVTDSQSGTWTEAVGIVGSTNVNTFRIFYRLNISGGSVTVTPSWTGSSPFRFAGAEFSGVSTTSPTDASDSLEIVSGLSPALFSSAGINTSVNGSVLLCGGYVGSGSTWTPATGWTQITSGSAGTYIGFRVDASGGLSAEKGGCSWGGGGTRNFASAIASFKADAAGGGQPFRKRWGGVQHNAYTRGGVW